VKVQGGVTQTQVVEGSISKEELLALVRETIHIPEGAKVRFYAESRASYGLLMNQHAQGISPVGQLVDVTTDEPLHFKITWEVPVAPKQG
jgi:hypothetical protein